jgi:hypothetical protein
MPAAQTDSLGFDFKKNIFLLDYLKEIFFKNLIIDLSIQQLILN